MESAMAGSAYPSEQVWAYPLVPPLESVWGYWLLSTSDSAWVSQQVKARVSEWEHHRWRYHGQYCRHRENQARLLGHNPLWPDSAGYYRRSHREMVDIAA